MKYINQKIVRIGLNSNRAGRCPQALIDIHSMLRNHYNHLLNHNIEKYLDLLEHRQVHASKLTTTNLHEI